MFFNKLDEIHPVSTFFPGSWEFEYIVYRAVTVAVAVFGCHRGCVFPPAVVHVTSHTL